jgi:hypothetical protein
MEIASTAIFGFKLSVSVKLRGETSAGSGKGVWNRQLQGSDLSIRRKKPPMQDTTPSADILHGISTFLGTSEAMLGG